MTGYSDIETMLKNKLDVLFNKNKFFNKNGSEVKLNIYEHSLPLKLNGKSFDPAPYIIVEANGGLINGDSESITITLYMCVCDGIGMTGETLNADRHAHRDLFHIIQNIKKFLLENKVLDKTYIVDDEIKWGLVEEDTQPFYYAGMQITITQSGIEFSDKIC